MILRPRLGHKIRVNGMRNNQGGDFGMQIDDSPGVTLNTWSENVVCGLLFEYDVPAGSHTMSLSLFGNWTTDGVALPASLHVTDITYVRCPQSFWHNF